MPTLESAVRGAALIAAALGASLGVRAEMSAEELAKLAQNPVGNLISVPFQNNTNFNVGPQDGTQNILNIQPVIPVSINKDWNIITRTIVPVVSMPALSPLGERENGLGDIQFTAFLSPAVPGQWIWGAGLVTQLPTNTHGLGNDNWGLGPTAGCCTSKRAARGCTARCSTTSGRCPATRPAVRTTTG
jgi:hypothetical protein